MVNSEKKSAPKQLLDYVSNSKKVVNKVIGSVVKKIVGNFKVSDVKSMRSVKVLYSNGLMSKEKYKALRSNFSRSCSIASKQRKAFQIMKGVQTPGEPASRLQATDHKAKVSEGFGALLGGAHAQTGKNNVAF